MTTKEALMGIYKFNRLNLTDDFKAHCVRVYIGCLLTPVLNIPARKKDMMFHDLHHIPYKFWRQIEFVGLSF